MSRDKMEIVNDIEECEKFLNGRLMIKKVEIFGTDNGLWNEYKKDTDTFIKKWEELQAELSTI